MAVLTTATTSRLLTTTRQSAVRTSAMISSRRTYSSGPPRRGNTEPVKFWPFLAVIAIGTGAFAYVSKQRAGQGRAPIARNEIPNR
ncbi:hypothetical protein F4808DRAFT_443700 [Astrocystis sublimbata]|nr:hypothetical protein F4808DRAFT_443700 [Astrocystis sublimbata]